MMKTKAECEIALNSAIDSIKKLGGGQEMQIQAIQDTKGYYEAIMSLLEK